MTTFNYNIKIISKDLLANTMLVEYNPIDNDVLTALIPVNSSSIVGDEIVPSTETVPRGRYLLTIPIPFTDQDLVEYIKSYAPLGVWEKMIADSQKQIIDVPIGEIIDVTSSSAPVEPIVPTPTIEIKKVVV
jgi:hypothetical protein